MRNEESEWRPSTATKFDSLDSDALSTRRSREDFPEQSASDRLQGRGKWRLEYQDFARRTAEEKVSSPIGGVLSAKKVAKKLKRMIRDKPKQTKVQQRVVAQIHFNPLTRNPTTGHVQRNFGCEVCSVTIFDADAQFTCDYCSVVLHWECTEKTERDSNELDRGRRCRW